MFHIKFEKLCKFRALVVVRMLFNFRLNERFNKLIYFTLLFDMNNLIMSNHCFRFFLWRSLCSYLSTSYLHKFAWSAYLIYFSQLSRENKQTNNSLLKLYLRICHEYFDFVKIQGSNLNFIIKWRLLYSSSLLNIKFSSKHQRNS